MKKFFVLIVVFVFIILGVFFFIRTHGNYSYYLVEPQEDNEVLAVVDFSLKSDKISKAENIFWYYLFTNYSLTKSGAQEPFEKDGTSVFLFDLDDDGVDEIIGTNWAGYFWGQESGAVFILKKNKDSYIEFCVIDVDTLFRNIYILKSKTNNYHDLMIEDKDGNKKMLKYFDWNLQNK